MTILEGDIKLLASERLTDTTDGGGRKTGTEIVSGAHNAVLPDISDIDRAYGRVNLRKLFLGVETPDTDVYYGAHVIVQTPPTDPSVSITLFSTGDHYDERSAAQDYVESYLARGPKWQGYLYDTQLKGQRAIRLIQRAAVRLPEVGETLVLIGRPDTAAEYFEFVRITAVSSVAWWRSSSALAKYALANFRISLVWRSSRTSRSSSLMRCCSAAASPV